MIAVSDWTSKLQKRLSDFETKAPVKQADHIPVDLPLPAATQGRPPSQWHQ
jgi:hypothetical protein